MQWSSLLTEYQSRFKRFGKFSAVESTDWLKYSTLNNLSEIWHDQDWDFRNSSVTINTTSGNLGGYPAPSGLVRFAQVFKIALFGTEDAERIRPIASQYREYFPYFSIEDGLIYFRVDPGNDVLTLNYVGELDRDIANIETTMALIDEGLRSPLIDMVHADLLDDSNRAQEAQNKRNMAKRKWRDYYDDKMAGTYQKQISPRGLNGLRTDYVARQLTILGSNSLLFADDY